MMVVWELALFLKGLPCLLHLVGVKLTHMKWIYFIHDSVRMQYQIQRLDSTASYSPCSWFDCNLYVFMSCNYSKA